jgi:NitT/TauT family transport system substrate-binding protein
MVTTMMLNDNGLTGQVERHSVGSIGAGITALREGGVDMIYVTEPVCTENSNSDILAMQAPEERM